METPDTVLLRAPRTSLSARLSERPVTQTAQKFQFTQVSVILFLCFYSFSSEAHCIVSVYEICFKNKVSFDFTFDPMLLLLNELNVLYTSLSAALCV